MNTANTNPKDLVFGREGVTAVIWVVDGGSVDKVYRYTLNSQNASIALVTSKQVFQYTNGRSVTGSTSPASTIAFVLTGVSNPQGIADPPADAPMDAVFSELG